MGLRLEGRHSTKYSETRGHWEESQRLWVGDLELGGEGPRSHAEASQASLLCCRAAPGLWLLRLSPW